MKKAITNIDNALGKGYAKEHPELIAALVQSSTQDFHTALLCKHIGYLAESISELCNSSEIERAGSAIASALETIGASVDDLSDQFTLRTKP